MDAQERNALLKQLTEGRDALVEALTGVDESAAQRRPASDRWSILECVEHLAIGEAYQLGQALAAQPAASPVVNEKRERLILERGTDRSRPVPASEVAKPAGRFAHLSDALQHFLAARARTIELVEKYDRDPRAFITTHPFLGQVNCYENLLLMAVHPLRHVKQIEECRDAIGR
jgi:hypothetical protein